jgi:Domain of unknown function (DUF4157)
MATATRSPVPAPAPASPGKPALVPHRLLTSPAATNSAPPAIRLGPSSTAGGEGLAPTVRGPIEQSLGVNLDGVRVHSNSSAQDAAGRLSARAFAFGPNIVVGRGERPTDLGLMAHEAAHVIQQQGAPRVQLSAASVGDSYEREAHQAASAVTQGESFSVRERTSGPKVQRLGISDALDYFADKANLIPGFRMFTILLGVNPINMGSVPRTAANILRAIIEFLPGGGLITQALDNYGIIEKVGSWVDTQLQTLGMAAGTIKAAITRFIDSLSWTDIFDLGGVWARAKSIFTEPIDRIINFAKGLVTGVITFIKDAIVLPIAKLAEGTRGWDLLCAVLGKNPITGEAVPRTAETLIGGFMKFIGQEEVWENIKKANALARAWTWFQSALSGLMGFVQQIPSLFINTLKSLELMDVVVLPRAFVKVGTVFGNFAVSFVTWAGNAVWDLLQIIFEVLAPNAIPYLKKVGATFKQILKNPMGFVGNLVKAGKLGFENFAAHIGGHLKASFLEWLTGNLPGVYIPKSFDFREILKLVLSVLGLTWANIREKLVKATSETIVKAMETGFKIVVTLVTEGPAAAWEQIKAQLTDLKDMVIQGIMDFIVETVVKKAVVKIVSFLIPGAGFIQAILTIYDTILVFIDKLKKIIQVAVAFLDSVMAIASGALGAAADKVEGTLAGLLTLAISFLAGFAGLGKIADKVMDIINKKVRAPIGKALDKAVAWIVTMAKKLFAAVFGKKDDDDARPEVQAGLKELDQLTAKYEKDPESKQDFEADVAKIKSRNKVFKSLSVSEQGDDFVYEYVASPGKKKKGPHDAKKIEVYILILKKLGMAPIANEKDAGKYREKMRDAIAEKFKNETVGVLNTKVFKSDVIPAPQNRIRGDIFEVWLQKNNLLDRQSPVFDDAKYKELAKKRIADGIRGTMLVDAKVRRPTVKPSPADKKQMEDYYSIILNKRVAVNQSDLVVKGPFTGVIYIFSDKSLISLWAPSLKELIPGKYKAE